jgi:hypothetical protein
VTTSRLIRAYAAAASALGLALLWAGIAARPDPAPAADAGLAEYEQRLADDAELVADVVAARDGRAATPAVRVVTLPPLTETRSS